MKSDSLYRVVHAMAGGEVRYCRDALRIEEGSMAGDRLLLFETLLSLPSYSSDAVVNTLNGRAILRNLPVEKTRLFGKLLKYVALLNESKKPPNDAYKRLDEAKVLVHLGILEEAAEIAKKGLASAIRVEDLQAEVLLRDLLRRVYKGTKNEKLIQEGTANEYLLETAANKLAKLMRYKVINDRAFDYLRRYRVSDAGDANKGMEELINLPEMRDIKMADSLPSQIRFYQTMYYYLSSKNKLNEAIDALTKSLQLWESNPEMIALAPDLYGSTLGNVLGKLSMTGRMDEAPTFLRKLEQVPVTSKTDEVLKFSEIELQHQLYFLNSGKLERVLKREKQTLGVINKYGKSIQDSTTLTLLYNLGVAHLLSDNPGKSLALFNRIREYGILSQRQDIQGVSRLIRLLLLEENDTAGTFSNYLRNSKRFSKMGRKAYTLEKLVLKWLYNHYRLTEINERKESFQELSSKLTKFVKDGMMGSEEIQIWACANSKQTSLRLVFKDSLHKQA
jgi:DNA-directed RNA polymerase subunit F